MEKKLFRFLDDNFTEIKTTGIDEFIKFGDKLNFCCLLESKEYLISLVDKNADVSLAVDDATYFCKMLCVSDMLDNERINVDLRVIGESKYKTE